ncbi:MAG: hypothetical protein R2798_06915 [Chitinophagales bacterium]
MLLSILYKIKPRGGSTFLSTLIVVFMMISQLNVWAQCAYTTGVCEGEDVSVSKSGGTIGDPLYNTVYYLVSAGSTTVLSLQDTDGPAVFSGLSVGNYEVYVINYLLSDTPTTDPLTLTDLTGITDGCYNANFLTDYSCVLVNPIVEICDGDTYYALTTGGTVGNELLYVLTDGTGSTIINTSLNPTDPLGADFTTDLSVGSFKVFALSYPAADSPSFCHWARLCLHKLI